MAPNTAQKWMAPVLLLGIIRTTGSQLYRPVRSDQYYMSRYGSGGRSYGGGSPGAGSWDMRGGVSSFTWDSQRDPGQNHPPCSKCGSAAVRDPEYRGNGYDNLSPEWTYRMLALASKGGWAKGDPGWKKESWGSQGGSWSGSIKPVDPTWGNQQGGQQWGGGGSQWGGGGGQWGGGSGSSGWSQNPSQGWNTEYGGGGGGGGYGWGGKAPSGGGKWDDSTRVTGGLLNWVGGPPSNDHGNHHQSHDKGSWGSTGPGWSSGGGSSQPSSGWGGSGGGGGGYASGWSYNSQKDPQSWNNNAPPSQWGYSMPRDPISAQWDLMRPGNPSWNQGGGWSQGSGGWNQGGSGGSWSQGGSSGWSGPPSSHGWSQGPPQGSGWNQSPSQGSGWSQPPSQGSGWNQAPSQGSGWSQTSPQGSSPGWSQGSGSWNQGGSSSGWSQGGSSGWSQRPSQGWSQSPPQTRPGWATSRPDPGWSQGSTGPGWSSGMKGSSWGSNGGSWGPPSTGSWHREPSNPSSGWNQEGNQGWSQRPTVWKQPPSGSGWSQGATGPGASWGQPSGPSWGQGPSASGHTGSSWNQGPHDHGHHGAHDKPEGSKWNYALPTPAPGPSWSYNEPHQPSWGPGYKDDCHPSRGGGASGHHSDHHDHERDPGHHDHGSTDRRSGGGSGGGTFYQDDDRGSYGAGSEYDARRRPAYNGHSGVGADISYPEPFHRRTNGTAGPPEDLQTATASTVTTTTKA